VSSQPVNREQGTGNREGADVSSLIVFSLQVNVSLTRVSKFLTGNDIDSQNVIVDKNSGKSKKYNPQGEQHVAG